MKRYGKRSDLLMTEVYVGGKRVAVPCAVAYDTKRLINKFRLIVTDISICKPYFIDDIQRQDLYELVLTVRPARVLKTRKFKNAHERTFMKFAKRFGWDLTIVEE